MENYCEWCHQADGISYPSLADPQPSSRAVFCAFCARAIMLISIRHACEVVQKSRKTIYQWIETGRAKYIRLADGRRLICYSSLFLPSDMKPRPIPSKKSSRPKRRRRKTV